MTYFDYIEYPTPSIADVHCRPGKPVTIVGGGPVGLATAGLLAARGVGSVVLNAAHTVGFGSRAICVSRRSLEILATIGVDREVMDVGLPWTGGRSYHRRSEIFSFKMPGDDSDRFPPMVNIQQCVLEKILLDKILADPMIDLRWGSRAVSFGQNPTAATVSVEAAAANYDLTSDWVVAADGARSQMRQLMGLELRGSSYEGRYVIADIVLHSDRPTERLAWFDPPSFPGKTVLMHKQPYDLWRIDYQIDPSENSDEAIKAENVLPRIAAHLKWIGEHGEWTPDWISTYRAHSLSLDNYRHGRTLFVGDAAHLVPIFGVRGLNGGLVDANNVSWRLAQVLSDGAAVSTLDTYATEQRYAWSENIRQAEQSTLFMTPGSPGRTLARDAALELAAKDATFAALMNPRQTSAIDYHCSPMNVPDNELWESGVAPGALVPDVIVGRVESGGGLERVHLSEVIDRFAVVCGAKATLPELGESQVIVLHSRADSIAGDIVDIDGALVAALSVGHEAGYVLRPDRHVVARRQRWTRTELDSVITAAKAGVPVTCRGHSAASASEPSHTETVWMRVGDALEGVPVERHAKIMTKFSLLLAEQLDDLEQVLTLLDIARAD